MRLAFDATALLGARTGVGVVTAELLSRLADRARPRRRRVRRHLAGPRRPGGPSLPDGHRVASRPMAARPLRQAWRRADQPADRVVDRPGRRRARAQLRGAPDPRRRRARDGPRPDLRPLPRAVHRRHARVSRTSSGGRSGAGRHRPHRLGVRRRRDRRRVRRRPRTRWSSSPTARDRCRPTSRAADADAGRALAGADRYVLAVGTVEPRKDLPPLVGAFDAAGRGTTRPRARDRRPRRLGRRGAHRRHRRQPRTATASCGSAGSTNASGPPCSAGPRSSPTPRSTRASACRRSRPWPPAPRW